MENEKKRPVIIKGIRQNCYALDINPNAPLSVKKQNIVAYTALKEKKLPNGFVVNLEKEDYPITSDSVTSYMDSADYKRDPLGAVANAPKRVNLGDITELQSFVENNPQEAVRVFRSVGEKLEKYYASKQEEEKTKEQISVEKQTGGVTNE